MTTRAPGDRVLESLTRPATTADLGSIAAIDAAAFPADSKDLEPAADGELLAGIEARRITVAEVDGEIVAFLQYDLIGSSDLDIISMAVKPGFESAGLGSRLLRDFLADEVSKYPGARVSAVTSPRNVGMIRLLTRNEFVVTKAVTGYFGDGKDRFYCQWRSQLPEGVAEERLVVPIQAVDYVFGRLEQGGSAITGVISGAQGTFFELCEVPSDDLAALRGNEASISVSESGAIVAGFTFMLGLSFVIPDFSVALRIVLLFATVLTTGALAIFANSSGNLARIRDNTFDNHMKWANLLLEFGGLYPFVIVLSAVFVQAREQTLALALIVSLLMSGILAAYEFSPFSLGRRYERRWYVVVGMIATVLLPAAYVPLTVLLHGDTAWLILLACVLVGRGVLQLLGGNTESRRARRAAAARGRS